MKDSVAVTASMKKETVQLEDGRYLIYYSFGDNHQKDRESARKPGASGKDEA